VVRVRAAAGAQVAAQGQAIVAGHHHVEHDQVDAVLVERGLHLAPVGGGGAAQALLLEVVGEQLADVAVVVDDQDVVGGRVHERFSMAGILRAGMGGFVSQRICGPWRDMKLQNAARRTNPAYIAVL